MNSPTRGGIFVVMGVSGSGKSTVAEALAKRIGAEFLDGDDYHPGRNIEKMAAGIPLNDTDRAGWLTVLARELRDRMDSTRPTVLACSALKKDYRRQLRVSDDVRFVYLKGSFDLIETRMRARQGHFMQADLLRSQFATLEEPSDEGDVWEAEVSQPVSVIVDRMVDRIFENSQLRSQS